MPPDNRSKNRAETFRVQGGLFCLDWDKANFKLFGASSDAEHSVIDVVAMPCNARATVFNATEDGILEDCNRDRSAAIDYLGDINIVSYYN